MMSQLTYCSNLPRVGSHLIFLLLVCTGGYASSKITLGRAAPTTTTVPRVHEADIKGAPSVARTTDAYVIKLGANTQIRVKTYTKKPFLGQAIKDAVFEANDVLITISGLVNTDFEWSLANVGGTKTATGGIFKFIKDDLEHAEVVDGDKLTITIAGQEIEIATYKPAEIWTWQDLQAMRQHLEGTYKLMDNIVFPDIDNNDIGDYNFVPVGSNITGTTTTHFTGIFTGNGYTIDKLYINHGAVSYVGLFGYLSNNARVRAVKLLHVVVSGNDYVGSLTGCSDGIVEGGYAIGRVTGISDFVGGFVGYNRGFVNGYTRGQVVGSEDIGGLVGANDGLVHGYTLASVRGSKNTGGLVGVNSGSVLGYAKNNVFGGENTGGLVGENIGAVDGYATGNVFGGENVGGLVGLTAGQVTGYSTGEITGSNAGVGGLVGNNTSVGFVMGYAVGRVLGSTTGIGGLVGINAGEVLGYATGQVRGGFDVGGLVGFNKGTIIGYATGSIMGAGDVGGFVGTTFGTVVGYATGYVADGIYVGGFVGSDFSSLGTVGYWDMKTTTQHSSAGGDQVIGISDIENITLQTNKLVDLEKYENDTMPIFAHPLFVRSFEPSTKKNGWPKIKKKIIINGKLYNFIYPQLS